MKTLEKCDEERIRNKFNSEPDTPYALHVMNEMKLWNIDAYPIKKKRIDKVRKRLLDKLVKLDLNDHFN